MIAGLLLAAGSARRYGSDKRGALLADGTPMLLASARALMAALPRVIVALDAADRNWAPRLRREGCQVVHAPAGPRGLGHSLAAAAAELRHETGCLVALADMPWIRPATHAAVAAALEAGAALAAPGHRGRRGHPVGFSARFFPALRALHGDTGARALLARHAAELRLLALDDPGVLRDLDHPHRPESGLLPVPNPSAMPNDG